MSRDETSSVRSGNLTRRMAHNGRKGDSGRLKEVDEDDLDSSTKRL